MTDYSELKMRLRGGIFTYGDERAALAAIEAQEKRIAELEARDDAALREATILAVSLAETHWPGNMDWRPLDKTAGVITQINNMCAGLDARIAELEKRKKHLEEMHHGWRQGALQANARIAELEAVLKPFAGMAKYCENMSDSESQCVLVGDLRAARSALNGEKG